MTTVKTAAKPAVKSKPQPEHVYGRGRAAVQKGLVYGAAVITFAMLLFLIAYILWRGIPNLKPSLFAWTYNSDNVSMVPAMITTVEITLLALLIAVPFGLFTAIYLNEYAKRGNKLVNVIRITTETLSGIPSIVYGLFGMLFFVTYLHWGYSLLAGAIGIVLVCLFMLIVYRIPGLVACLALGFYIVIEAVVFGLIRVNLSLPGIAGIILSIGMAVDANVIIFERIKEELRAGKTVKSAIDSGFKRAFTAILDSNITTLIAAAVLFWMGTGTIVGFATTLGLGVIISMFTALTVTHFLLNRMVDFHVRSPKAYGV